MLRNTLVAEDTHSPRRGPAAARCADCHLRTGRDRHGNGRGHPKPGQGTLPGKQRDGHAVSCQCRGPRVRRHHPDGGSASVREAPAAAARGNRGPRRAEHLPAHRGLPPGHRPRRHASGWAGHLPGHREQPVCLLDPDRGALCSRRRGDRDPRLRRFTPLCGDDPVR